MSSSFVENAAREAAQADVLPGDPEAEKLLASARARIYHWPVDFGGFRSPLIYQDGDVSLGGLFECQGSRKLKVELPELDDGRWLRFQLEELTSHREAPEVSKMASRTGCSLGDWDNLYGRRIDFLGDKMSSFYRIKDDRLCQIGRSYGSQNFTINIDSHLDCGGFWASEFYSAYYWDKEGALLKTETYLDRYQQVGEVWLPAERRVSEASASGLRTRRLLFSDLQLL